MLNNYYQNCYGFHTQKSNSIFSRREVGRCLPRVSDTTSLRVYSLNSETVILKSLFVSAFIPFIPLSTAYVNTPFFQSPDSKENSPPPDEEMTCAPVPRLRSLQYSLYLVPVLYVWEFL